MPRQVLFSLLIRQFQTLAFCHQRSNEIVLWIHRSVVTERRKVRLEYRICKIHSRNLRLHFARRPLNWVIVSTRVQNFGVVVPMVIKRAKSIHFIPEGEGWHSERRRASSGGIFVIGLWSIGVGMQNSYNSTTRFLIQNVDRRAYISSASSWNWVGISQVSGYITVVIFWLQN